MVRKGTQKLSQERLRRIDRYLLRVYGSVCQYCFRKIDRTLPIDHLMSWSRNHIVPWAMGGDNKIQNFEPMHKKCNELAGRQRPTFHK